MSKWSRRRVLRLAATSMIVAPRNAAAIAFGEVTLKWPIVARIALPLVGGGRATFATAAFITPEWLLTAGHVAASLPGNAFVQSAAGEFDILDALAHPAFGPNRSSAAFDIGLLRVDSKSPSNISIPALAEADIDGLANPPVIFVGHGRNEHGVDTGEKRQGRMAIKFVAPEEFACFSDPAKREPFLQPGDSGGPVFAAIAGRHAIIGVASAAAPFFGEKERRSAFASVTPARAFIDQVVPGLQWLAV